jgi:hypothetical protein
MSFEQIETNHLLGVCELDNGRRLQLASITFYGRNCSGTPYNRRHLPLELQAGWSASWKISVVADSVVQLGWFVLDIAAAKPTG